MKTRNSELNKFIVKFYLYKLFSVMGFIIPFITIMFDANGLSATQIAICMMFSRIVQIITEIPSGSIADKYSRKYVLLISRLLNGIPWIIWILYPSFWGYLAGYIFFGLNNSLDSGCAEAFVYDELSKYEKRNSFERVLGRGGSLTSVGIFIASVTASILAKLGYSYNFLMFLSFVTTIISALMILIIKPAKKQKDSDEPDDILTYVETLKKGVKYAFGHKFVLKFILFLSFSNFINVGINQYEQIFFNEMTRGLTKVAILFALMQIIYALGQFFGEYLKVFSFKKLMMLFFIASLFDPLVFYIYKYPISVVISMIDTLFICAIFINFRGKMNDEIPSKIRATTLSVQGFIEGFCMLVCLFLFGLAVDYFKSYRMGFLLFSCIFAIGSFIFLILFVKDKNLK